MVTEVGYTKDEMQIIEDSHKRIFDKLSGNIIYD